MAKQNFMTMRVDGMEELKVAFKKSPQIVKEFIDPAIHKALFNIQAKATPHIPTDRGELRNRQTTIFSTLKGVLENRAPYAMYVHGDGSSARSKPHFPPLEAIRRWADRHGIPPFLVARAIARKGTKLIPFYDMGIKESDAINNAVFASALNKITLKLAK